MFFAELLEQEEQRFVDAYPEQAHESIGNSKVIDNRKLIPIKTQFQSRKDFNDEILAAQASSANKSISKTQVIAHYHAAADLGDDEQPLFGNHGMNKLVNSRCIVSTSL